MGPPDLIGRVKLGTDSILAMVSTATPADDGGLGHLYRKTTATSTADAPPAVAWMELVPDDNVKTTTTLALSSSTNSSGPFLSNSVAERNPFESLGDIAVAIKARLPLPASLEEYELSKVEKGVGVLRGIADAGVRVSAMKTTTAEHSTFAVVGEQLNLIGILGRLLGNG